MVATQAKSLSRTLMATKIIRNLEKTQVMEQVYNCLSANKKIKFKVKHVLEFHEMSNGGWFFKNEEAGSDYNDVRAFNIYQLSWKDVVKRSNSAMACLMETVWGEIKQESNRASLTPVAL
jgi:hypothetical protein